METNFVQCESLKKFCIFSVYQNPTHCLGPAQIFATFRNLSDLAGRIVQPEYLVHTSVHCLAHVWGWHQPIVWCYKSCVWLSSRMWGREAERGLRHLRIPGTRRAWQRVVQSLNCAIECPSCPSLSSGVCSPLCPLSRWCQRVVVNSYLSLECWMKREGPK